MISSHFFVVVKLEFSFYFDFQLMWSKTCLLHFICKCNLKTRAEKMLSMVARIAKKDQSCHF